MLAALARATGAAAIAALDGATLLGERAMLNGYRIPGRHSAGGGCALYAARGGAVALNLARPDDRDLLPALFEADALAPADDAAIARAIAVSDPNILVARGRLMGLAIAHVDEAARVAAVTVLGPGPPAAPCSDRPRVLDLSALWAGPLAAHLLWLAGAEVVKAETPARPDRMRHGDPAFFALLNQGKASLLLDPRKGAGRAALLHLIARADIVIESARPRALRHLGIDAAALVRARPGLVWIGVTAHGIAGERADWVGFGDDVGVAAGLSAALHAASGAIGFVGDAIADPLTGIAAARVAWEAWASGRGGHYAVAMRGVAADALMTADVAALDTSLRRWAAAAGAPFPAVRRRIASVPTSLGADTTRLLAEMPPC